jgi:hypothetical protein
LHGSGHYLKEKKMKEEYDFREIPQYMHGGIIRYIEDGIMPGDFLSSVLQNDLKGACGAADQNNKHLLWDYVAFLYNNAPSMCWGSPEKVKAWVEEKRPK